MSSCFISYNRRSEAIVKTLADDIETLGHKVWLDQELSGGQAWWDQILSQIRACEVFVFALAPEALNSTACTREYEYAADVGKPILPVLVAKGVSTNLLPLALSAVQFVDYREQDRDAALRLARAINNIPPPKPLPDPLPVPPEVPVSYLGRLHEQVETTSALSFEEQSALVIDLKRGLRDPETHDDATTLIDRLKQRRDLLASISDEIDEILASATSTSLPSSVPQPASPEPSPKDESPLSTPEVRPTQETSLARQIFAAVATLVILFILGIGAGSGTEAFTGQPLAGFIPAVPLWVLGVILAVKAWRYGRIFGRKAPPGKSR